MPAVYELAEAEDIQASHLPHAGFQRNPRYTLENERRYHDEPGSRAKVLENSMRLDPAFLLESVDANHGAPVVDAQGNVLGGNGRAMSIQYAYDGEGKNAATYRDALRANAERLGLNQADVGSMKRPVLVRRVAEDMSPEERQALVTAMNDDFKDSREKRSEGITRGERLSEKAIFMLSEGMKSSEAGSLREYFDSSSSAALVNQLMEDGVLQRTERNALVGADGLLNPDGKTKVESALRVLYVNGREALAALPDDTKAKMDVALPHMLRAENVGGEWAILNSVREANDLIVAYKASGHKEPRTFLNQVDMLKGEAPAQSSSPLAVGIFTHALENKKTAFTDRFKRYANAVENSATANALPGIGKPYAAVIEEQFGVKPGTSTKGAEKGTATNEKTSASIPAQQDTARQKKIDDFGEKIGGARKDVWTEWRTSAGKLSEEDVLSKPLEKIFPEPKYDKLLSDGAAPKAVALVHALRDVVTEQKRKLKSRPRLAGDVQKLVESAAKILDSQEYYQRFADSLKANPSLQKILSAASLYEAVGHAKSLAGLRVTSASYSVYNGVRYDPAKIFWTVEKEAPKTAFSNWPRVLAEGVTREEALENFKKAYAKLDLAKPAKKDVSFILYHDQGKVKEVMIGVKVGRNYVPLAGSFATAPDARAYLAENKDALAEKLNRLKEIPNERRDINNPRVGEDMRDGQDVTPEMFSEAFGFRGVEFGNWVEKDRRQSNLNEAYDALMDLAGIIGVTPKALSLNGELGLAFGARGRPARTAGGSVPAAHYEADRVVINITKKSGAGSLAHEWFHAVDNYFSRMRGRSGEYLSDALDVSIASSGGSPVYNAGPLRKEIIDAWSKIRAAITQSGLKARSETLDIVRSNPYWGTNIELGARAFEAYIVEKLQDNNASNDYLVNIVDEKVWSAKGELTGDKKEYPYPTSTELPSIVAAFDNLFQTVEQRETASGVALASLRNVNQQQDDGKLLLSIIAPGQFLPQRNTGSGMRLRDVQRITRALDGIARAAAPVQVVQNYDALPERLRKHFAEQAKELEAAYDPQDGTVYFVADNLTSAERVAEVWLHEQVVHHGLRSLLTEGERKRLLNRLWESSGGMSNADIADIAQRYGLRPTLKQEDRSIVVEEYLALLAEKKKGGLLLSRGDKSVWRRFVEAVAKAWRAMVAKATGGRITSVGSADIDALLTALGEHVMGGLPQEGGTLDTALASLGGGDAKHEASVAAWEQLQRDAEAWGQQLDDYKSTPGGEAGQRELLTVCRTPDVLQKLGAADLPMTMTTGNLGKVLSDKVDHGLPKVLVKQLPHALAQPIMVFESASRSDSFVVLTELKHDGRSVMVAVHLDTERQHVRVNDIASMYKRGNEAWYVRQIEEGRLLYQDKKKSLAWARTNGLQLPKVRKLPARLSDGRILSEVDVVKPLPPSGDVPLASLFDKLTGVEKALKLVENENIQPMFPNKTDLTTLKRTIMLPHWIAKRFPQFGTIYNRQLRRMDERNADKMQSLQSVPSLFGDKKDQLNGKDMDDLRKLIWDNEGKQISELKGTEKFLDADTLANGRSILKENPAWYKAYGKWLEKQPGSTKAKQAMLEVRRSLDSDLMRAHNRMAAMSELSDSDIADHRTTINHQHNYFPHHRYGQWYVQAKVGNEVVFRQHFDAVGRSMAKKKAAEIIAEQRKNYPNAAWRADENEKLPEEVYGAPMDMEAMEQVIKAAASRIGDKEQADSVRSALHEAIADTLKARGWGSHAIGRKGIPGHEDQDILRVLYDYKSGLSGWLTKMEAAKDFTEALGKIDARRHPTEWGYAAQYVKDMLRNYDKIDRLAGNIKSVAFAWYLGANLKTAVLNLTQNVITGVPRLHMDTVGSAGYMRAAMAAIVDQVTGGKGAGLAEDEAQLLQELYDNSVITDGYMEEVRGRVSGVDGAVMWNKLLKGMGWFMSVAERFNRASLALAAYRAARGGNLTQKAQSMHGIEGRADYDQAKAYAETIVRDAHFVYGKANMPEALRSSAAGRAISTAYTFRTFSHNLLSLWSWALRTQGKEGAKMVAKGLSATLLIGGVSSAPFFATAMALFQAFAGDDDDWLETVRGWATEYLGANEMMRDVASYGLPAVAGVNLGGSLKMETPFSQGLKKGSTPKEVLTESIGDIIGIPYDLFVQRPSKVMDAYKNRNAYRMVEEAAPTFVQNAMRAWRLHDDGQKTMSGRDINEPGKKGARKLSEMEMVGKLLGFQPVSATKSYDRYSARQHADKVRSDKAGEFAARMLNARESKNSQDMVEARKDLRQWNEDMRNEGKTWMVIRQEDVQRRMSARRRENKLTPRERGRQKAQSGVWGN